MGTTYPNDGDDSQPDVDLQSAPSSVHASNVDPTRVSLTDCHLQSNYTDSIARLPFVDEQGGPELCYVTDESGVIVSLDSDIWNAFLISNIAANDGSIPDKPIHTMYPGIIGRNLFEFICGDKVQSFFRLMIYMLKTDMQNQFIYHWYCDSANMERKMSMRVSKMTGRSNRQLILWQSKIIKETQLSSPQAYLDAPNCHQSSTAELPMSSSTMAKAPPTRTVCSYCKRILVPWNDIQNLEAGLNITQKLDAPYNDPDMTKQKIPIIGYRGKLGLQHSRAGNPTHLWLTPSQYYGSFLDDNIAINHGICELCHEEMVMIFTPIGSFKEGERILESMHRLQ